MSEPDTPWYVAHSRETGHSTEDTISGGMRCLDCDCAHRLAQLTRVATMTEQHEDLPGEAALARVLTSRWLDVKAAVKGGSPLGLARIILEAEATR